MNILAFDTSMRACSAAFLHDACGTASLTVRFEELERGHAEALMPMIAEILEEAGIGYGDINRIAVTTGPGTFTGVRVGIAAARGLALATGAELVGSTSLAVMAGSAIKASQKDIQHAAIATDARRGEVYFALYETGGRCIHEPAALAPHAAVALLPSHETTLLAGSGAAFLVNAMKSAESTQEHFWPAPIMHDLQPDAAVLCHMALELSPSVNPVSPLYLRAPDAKPQTGAALPRR